MEKVEKWSLGYFILRPWIQFAHRLGHKEFHVIGKNSIPKDKPVIFAPNHQNALMDALAIVATAPGQTVFLARADIFKKKFIASLLYFIKIIPVYRIRDGKDSLQKNDKTFNKSIQVLKENKHLCLFPEGAHIGKRSMMAHKKAIPRIVFLAAEKTNFEIDIQVVPVGITYSHYYNYRRNAIIHYGDPIPAKEYYSILKEEGEQKATLAFRDRIYDGLSSLIVNIPDKDVSDLYESAFTLFRAKILKKLKLSNRAVNRVKADQYFTDKLHSALKASPDKKEWFVNTQKEYNRLRNKLNLNEWTIERNGLSFGRTFLTTFLTLLLLPISLPGAIINGWLFYVTRYPLRKKIKDQQFWSSVSFGVGLIAFTLYYLILWLILSLSIKAVFTSLLLVLATIPAGIVAYEIGMLLLKMKNGSHFNSLKKKNDPQLALMLEKKNELLTFFESIS